MKKLILISGISGAGKTTVSNILEDMGYTCIDQYPVELLGSLLKLLENSEKYPLVALTIPLSELPHYYSLLANTEVESELILLDASIDEIINRYKFTRRVHPLLVSNKATTLKEAVEIEKNILESFRLKNCHIIDTTGLMKNKTKEKLDHLLNYDDYNNFAISFISFGYKNGVPDDADFVFDVRVLDNPFYVPELKNLTGNDREVQDYVLNNSKGQEYLKKLLAYLDNVLELYDNEEKHHLTICIGCTGGQHRSVTVANYLYEHYAKRFSCRLKHREL